MIGTSATTALTIGTLEHIRQSVADILSTPLGSRVMRREYGSALFALTDAPMDRVTVLDIVQAATVALGRWEPRVRLMRVDVSGAEAGHMTLDCDVRYLETGEPVRLEGIVV